MHNRIKIITDIVYELRTFLKNTGINVSLKEVSAPSADISVRDFFGITAVRQPKRISIGFLTVILVMGYYSTARFLAPRYFYQMNKRLRLSKSHY